MEKVRTRFAPSPTGLLHIGSARTALFNWLFTKRHNGKFLLRIEDTDIKRSTKKSVDTIINGLKWLGINWNDEIVYQSKNIKNHQEIAYKLLKKGHAYYCYTTQEEIEDFKKKNPKQKFISKWREDTNYTPKNNNYVIRLKVDNKGHTIINDLILGEIKVENEELDDMVLLRSDGTPTYMLAVVVDDHNMKINHIIRGSDHLTNTFRQIQIYKALGWETPKFAHIPLIHGKDGAKLSKRHGALGVESYKDMGYLPEAMCNYLLRLGWGHKDIEIITMEDAIKIFDLSDIGKAPAKFDIDKLNYVNGHYISTTESKKLLNLITPFLKTDLDDILEVRILNALKTLKTRVSTIEKLAEYASLYIKKKAPKDEKSIAILTTEGKELLQKLLNVLQTLIKWNADEIKKISNAYAKNHEIKLSKVMQTLRAGVIGTFSSPAIFEMLEILGKEEVLKRIKEEL